METIRTGLDFLDQEMHGFRRGKPYLIFGHHGCGKSSFGVQYAAAGLAHGETVLYVYHGRGEELLELAATLGFRFETYLANENLILVEVDDEVRTLVQQRGPEVALDALRQQFHDVEVQRVVFDPVNVFFSELHNEALLRADIWAITSRLAPLSWTPLMLWDHDESSTQTTALRVFSEECWGLFELRTTPEADTVTDVSRQHTHNFIVYKLRDAQLSRRRFQLRLGENGFHGVDATVESASATHPFTRFRTLKAATDGAADTLEAPVGTPEENAVAPELGELTPNEDTARDISALAPPAATAAPTVAPQTAREPQTAPPSQTVVPVTAPAAASDTASSTTQHKTAERRVTTPPAVTDTERSTTQHETTARPAATPPAAASIAPSPTPPTSPTVPAPPTPPATTAAPAAAAAAPAPSPTSARTPSKKPTAEQLAALANAARPTGAPRKNAAPDKEALESLPDRRACVLIVDDDTISRQMAIDAIGHEWDVLEATNALDGLVLALTKHPDIILLDVVMPKTSGPELCGTLRELGVNAPIIFLSARLDQPQVQGRCFELGGTDTLSKPFEPKKLRSKVRRHITESLLNPATWPEINLEDAKHRLGQKEVGLPSLENRLARALQKAKTSSRPISLLGYEFRFVTGNEGHAFVEHFVHVLNKAIGQNDDLCRTSERRLVVVLYGADRDMARNVVQRAHRKMKSAATLLVGRATVKPKALFRLLHLAPEPLQNELPTPQELVRKLFQQPAHLIEEEGDQKPGEPMEKYPLLEAVFFALRSDAKKCTSPLNGAQYFIETLRPSGVRKVTIGEYTYRSQDPSEPTPTGIRQRDGSFIVWVTPHDAPNRIVARIEDERVFRNT